MNLPPPTTEEENYLNSHDLCWDVYNPATIGKHDVAVVDSGSKHTICFRKDQFIHLTLFTKSETPYVKVADDSKSLPIRGFGTVDILLNNHRVQLSALFVPDMKTMLISVSQHIQYQGCTFYAANNTAFLTFPSFYTEISNETELTVLIKSPSDISPDPQFVESMATLSPSTTTTLPPATKTQSPRNHLCPNGHGNFIQIDKTRGPHRVRARRVNIPLSDPLKPPSQDPATTPDPSNIPQDTNKAKVENSKDHTSPSTHAYPIILDFGPINTPHPLPHTILDDDDDESVEEVYTDFVEDRADAFRIKTVSQHSDPLPPVDCNDTNIDMECDPASRDDPTISIEDRPNSALPKKLNITRDRLLQSIGYLNIDQLVKLLPDLVKDHTIHIQSDRNPSVFKGEHATMASTSRSTQSTTMPQNFGDCWHVDIGFGPGKAIGGARYCLFFVDKKILPTQGSHPRSPPSHAKVYH